jgi:hypothetical protein
LRNGTGLKQPQDIREVITEGRTATLSIVVVDEQRATVVSGDAGSFL